MRERVREESQRCEEEVSRRGVFLVRAEERGDGVGGVRAVLSEDDVERDDDDIEDGEHENCGSVGS